MSAKRVAQKTIRTIVSTAVVIVTLIAIILVITAVVLQSQSETCEIVAHRGSSKAPENTMAAIRMSGEEGFSIFECDVSVTLDGVPVLMHDETIDRTSDGTGDVRKQTFYQLSQYDYGSWKASDYAGEPLPTLEEVLEFCATNNMFCELDLTKSDLECMDADEIIIVYDTVKSCEAEENVTFLGYSWQIEIVLELDPTASIAICDLRTSADIETWSKVLSSANRENAITYVSIPFSETTIELIDKTHDVGMLFRTWTLRDEASVYKAVALGCDRIVVEDVSPKFIEDPLSLVQIASYNIVYRVAHDLLGAM